MNLHYKLTVVTAALLILGFAAGAQTNSVSIGTNSTNASAVLWLNSPGGNQGLIIPVGSRASVVTPAKGMLIFDTNQVYAYDGANWNTVGGSGTGSSYSLSYNATTKVITLNPNTSGTATIDISTTAFSGGDLGGTLAAPTVTGLQTKALPSLPATLQYLAYDGTTSSWKFQSPSGSGDMLKATYDTNNDNTVDAAASLTSTLPLSKGGTGITTTPGANQVLTTNGSSTVGWTNISALPSGPVLSATQVLTGNGTANSATVLSGDASINAGSLTVTGIQNKAVTLPSSGIQYLSYDVTQGKWVFQTPTGSGDMLKATYDTNNDNIVDAAASLSTTLPLAKGGTGITTTPGANQVLTTNGSSTVGWTNISALPSGPVLSATQILTGNGTVNSATVLSGDASINSGVLKVTGIQNKSITLPGAGIQYLSYDATLGQWVFQTPSGSGDMLKATYDANGNNIVDNSEKIGGSTWPTNTPGALTNNGSGTLSWASYQTPLTFSTGLTNSSGTITVNPSQNISTLSNLSTNGLIKTSGGTGALSIATSGTDYAPATSGSSILYGNGTGGFSNVVIGSNLSFTGGTLSATGGGTYLAGTGLTLTTNTFSVNPSQNISTLSNLSTNGLIKTSGGTGALSIATAGTDYVVTESDPTVKAINGLVKSNGTTIGAVVSGTDIKTINSTSLLGSGNINLVTTESDPIVKLINGIVKSNGTTISAAAAGTDFQAPITLTTTGTSGAATFISNTLNIPNYSGWSLSGNSLSGTEFIGSTTASDLIFKTNSTERFRMVNTTGYLGLGTTSPQAHLGISGATMYDAGVSLANTGGGTEWRIGSDTDGTLKFVKIPGSTITPLTLSSNGAIGFLGNFGTAGYVLTSSGSTGPPTWTQVATFSTNNVIPKGNGTGLASSLLYDNGTGIGLNTTSPATDFQIDNTQPTLRLRSKDATTLSQSWVEFGHDDGTGGFTKVGAIGDTGSGDNLYLTSPNSILFNTNLGDRFSIGTKGELGVGNPLDFGTAGYVLTSQGSGTPAKWTSLPSTFNASNIVPKGNGTTLTSSLIYDDGNYVGIGTNIPAAGLHLKTSSGSLAILDGTPNPLIQYLEGGVYKAFTQLYNNDFVLGANSGSNQLHLFSNGNYGLTVGKTGTVGINNASPGTNTQLDVQTYLGTAINATNNSTGNAIYAYATNGGTGVWGYSPTATGVEGQSGTANGVFGYSDSGNGVYGSSNTGTAGYFAGNVVNTGYTQLGSGAPQVKMAYFTAVMPSVASGTGSVATGFTHSQIIGVQVTVEYVAGSGSVGPGYTYNSGYYFDWYEYNGTIFVNLSASNSASLYGKTARILVTYTP